MRASRKAKPVCEKYDYTYGDIQKNNGKGRFEVIEGVVYDMTPAPATEHQRISRDLGFLVHEFLKGKKCELFSAPFDVLLPEGDEADVQVKTVVQPDIVVVCDPEKITPRGCRGAPNWVVEILSPATAGKDQILKRRIYEKAGVREYWVVHPTDRTIMVYRLQKSKLTFVDTYDDQAELKVNCLPGFLLKTSDVFPPQPKVVDTVERILT